MAIDRTGLEQLVGEAKEPPIMGLLPKWHIKSKKEASWSPAKDHLYRIHHERDGWEFSYFAPGARTGERSGPKAVFVHGYKAADAAEADWKERSAKKTESKLDEKSPPGWEGTVKAMKKHPEITNPWALAWSMRNKGAKPHYKLNKRKQPVKTEEMDLSDVSGKNESRLRNAVAGLRDLLGESVSRYAELWKASNGSWYLNLAPDEHGEYEDAYTYGPFSSEDAADTYLSRNFSNPGAFDVDSSGSQPPPEKSPNGKPVIRGRR